MKNDSAPSYRAHGEKPELDFKAGVCALFATESLCAFFDSLGTVQMWLEDGKISHFYDVLQGRSLSRYLNLYLVKELDI